MLKNDRMDEKQYFALKEKALSLSSDLTSRNLWFCYS